MEKDAQARDTESENIVGNLLVAEYQVEKLRDRVVSRIGSVYPSETTKKCLQIYSNVIAPGSKFHLMLKRWLQLRKVKFKVRQNSYSSSII